MSNNFILTLDSNPSTVTISNITRTRISNEIGYNECSFDFQSNEIFIEYKVKVVPSSDSLHTEGTVIPTTNGSINMSGTGTFAATTDINCTIKVEDFKTIATVDGDYIVKVFVKDEAGNWN